MTLFSLLALLPLFLTAESTTPPAVDSPPVDKCVSFSMEGISPGMTVAEIEAINVEVKMRRAFIPVDQKGKLYRFTGEKRSGEFTLDDDGMVKSLTVHFIGQGLSLVSDVDYEMVVKILAERWGPPKTDETVEQSLHNAFNAVIGHATIKKATWENRPCKQVAQATQLTHQRLLGHGLKTSVLTVTIAKDISLDDLEALELERERKEQDARESIKF